jgi:hypothetical protein
LDHAISGFGAVPSERSDAEGRAASGRQSKARWLQSGVMAFVEESTVVIRLPDVVDPEHGMAVLESLDAVLLRSPMGACWRLDFARIRQIPAYLLVSLFSFGKALRSAGGRIEVDGINPAAAGADALQRFAQLLPLASGPSGGTGDAQ